MSRLTKALVEDVLGIIMRDGSEFDACSLADYIEWLEKHQYPTTHRVLPDGCDCLGCKSYYEVLKSMGVEDDE